MSKRNPKSNGIGDLTSKQLIRGTQKSTKQHQATVKTHKSPSLYQDQQKEIRVPTANSSKEKYRVPQLHTTMGLANQIDQLKAKTGPKYNDVCDLTPRSKLLVTERVKYYFLYTTLRNGHIERNVFLDHTSIEFPSRGNRFQEIDSSECKRFRAGRNLPESEKTTIIHATQGSGTRAR